MFPCPLSPYQGLKSGVIGTALSRSSMLVANGTWSSTSFTFQESIRVFVYSILAHGGFDCGISRPALADFSKYSDQRLVRVKRIWRDWNCSGTPWYTLGLFIFSKILLCKILFLPFCIGSKTDCCIPLLSSSQPYFLHFQHFNTFFRITSLFWKQKVLCWSSSYSNLHLEE